MDNTAQWHLVKRLGFCFFFTYFVLYNLPFPFDTLPFGNFIAYIYYTFWYLAVPWITNDLLKLHYEIDTTFNGSGDTIFHYLQVLYFFVTALTITLIWRILDHKRPNYNKLHHWLRIYIRFSLANKMLIYGAIKVVKSQFPSPPLDKLLQPFGDSSPMGLLWTFMGFSESYNIFTGAAEMLGGLLLVSPSLTTLGALVCIGVLSNVVMLNFSYDVPVKLFSTHLLVMAIFLTIPDLGRLANMFILNRRVEPVEFPPLFKKVWLNQAVKVLGIVFILYLSSKYLYSSYQTTKAIGDLSAKSPLYGIWLVDEFQVDGQIRLNTDETRWKRVVFDTVGRTIIFLSSDSKQYFLVEPNIEKKTLTFRKGYDPKWQADFLFERLNPKQAKLEGKLDGHKTQIKLQKVDESKFPLNSRGFHWVNEYPFNY